MLPQPWRALTPRRDLNPAASETACQELNTAKAFKVTGKKGGTCSSSWLQSSPPTILRSCGIKVTREVKPAKCFKRKSKTRCRARADVHLVKSTADASAPADRRRETTCYINIFNKVKQ
jgi:hypothetical protein